MNVLVTGGLGFLGGRIASLLSRTDRYVTIATRRTVGRPDWLKNGNQVQINWEDENAIINLCRGIDVLIHAAGMNMRACEKSPIQALNINGLITEKLVDAAIQAGVKRFLYLSTAHVYSPSMTGRVNEETCPRNMHPYATSHLAGEFPVRRAAALGQLEGIVLRLSNAYGNPMDANTDCWSLFINNLCKQAVEARKLVLRGIESEQRDFIGIADVCRVVEGLSFAKTSCNSEENVINVGTGIARSLLEVANIVQSRCLSVLGFKPEIILNKQLREVNPIPYSYQSIRLEKLGISVDNFLDLDEIDLILRSCWNISKRPETL